MAASEELRVLILQADVNGVNEFIRKGGDVNGCYEDGDTPLLVAIHSLSKPEYNDCFGKKRNCCEEIAIRLINAGANVNPSCDISPLISAINARAHPELIYALINAGSDLNAVSAYQETPLACAIWIGYNKLLIDDLIRRGANVNCGDRWESTPLNIAIQIRNNFEIVMTLIDAGAFMTIENNSKNVFNSICCGNSCSKDDCEYKKIIDFLLDKGADIKVMDCRGKSVVHRVGCNYLINLCVTRGLSVNLKDNKGQTPLMDAVRCNNIDKVKSLLFLFNADVNCFDSDLNTPLHHAAEYGSNKICDLLLYFGANLFVKNARNETPLVASYYNVKNYNIDYYQLLKFPSHAVIMYYLLFISESGLSDHFTDQYEHVERVFHFFKEHKNELANMKYTFLKDNLSFYDFFMLKKYHKSQRINIFADELKYNTEQIKEMFPFYQNSILLRLRDNQIKQLKRDLLIGLNNIVIRPLAVNESVTEEVELIYDCKDLVARYLDIHHLYNLFLASVDY